MTRIGPMLTLFKHSDPGPTRPVTYTEAEYVKVVQRGDFADRQHDILYALHRDGTLGHAAPDVQRAAHEVLSDYALYTEWVA